ncbi:hypothetical protein RJT34_28173 [Clitoria ternatea]|uniref:LysM domain-containing protein n=1 Tax=Clitoria ternatea TaxID=43366 RepID=A0AAN9FDN6_CLITE
MMRQKINSGLILIVSNVLLLLTVLPLKAKSFKCWEARRCGAMVGYSAQFPTTIGAIQKLFNVTNAADILAANGLPEWTPSNNFTVEENRVIKIPFQCDCSGPDGEPISPPVYRVPNGENISYIITTVFSGLVGTTDILQSNNISMVEDIGPGQELRMPLPCSCGKVKGVDVVHFGLTLDYGMTFENIAEEYGVDEDTIWDVNQATSPALLLGRALDIPLPACSSMVRNDSLDYPLLVPNGSYVYTANGCVKCKCNAANNWTKWKQVEDITHCDGRSNFCTCILLLFQSNLDKIQDRRRKRQKKLIREIGANTIASNVNHRTRRHGKDGETNYEMRIFCFASIAAATDNFSAVNKLGEGGFGPVYKKPRLVFEEDHDIGIENVAVAPSQSPPSTPPQHQSEVVRGNV